MLLLLLLLVLLLLLLLLLLQPLLPRRFMCTVKPACAVAQTIPRFGFVFLLPKGNCCCCC